MVDQPKQPPVKFTEQPLVDRHPGALWKGKRTDELDVPPTPVPVSLKPFPKP